MDIPGTPGNDTLLGTDLADVFRPGPGLDTIDGLQGVDEVALPGAFASYTINSDVNTGIVQITDGVSQYTLRNIERVVFADAGIDILKQFTIFNGVVGDAGEIWTAPLAGGGYVVSWSESPGTDSGAAYFQVYDGLGNPVGSRTQVVDVRVNGFVSVTQLTNGNILAAWRTDENQVVQVQANVFTPEGIAVGSAVIVSEQLADFPTAVALTDGGWAVAHFVDGPSRLSIKIYNSDNSFRAALTYEDPGGLGIGFNSLTPLSDGSLVLSYGDNTFVPELNEYRSNLSYSVISSLGSITNSGRIVSGLSELYGNSVVTPIAAGGWQITYAATGLELGAVTSIYRQTFGSDGSALAPPVALGFDPTEFASMVTVLADGGSVIVWFEAENLVCQRYDQNGQKVGNSIDVTSPTDGGMATLRVTALDDGGWIITWTSISGQFWTPDGWLFPPEGATNTGYARRFSADGSSYTSYSLNIYGDGTDQVFVGGGGNDFIASAAGADVVTAGAGNDVVLAGLGNDLIVGGSGAGDDYYDGGEGEDTVRYLSATAGIVVDLSKNTASSNGVGVDAGIGRDQLFGIENIVAGNFDDVVIGDAVANRLSAENGNDQVRGNGGNDFIDGGAGEDTAIYAGAAARYTFTRNNDGTWTIVDTLAGVDNEGTDTLSNIEKLGFSDGIVNLSGKTKITGTTGPDRLIGTSADEEITGLAGNDRILANGGDDLVDGGAGNDFMDGGTNTVAGDTVSYASATSGVTVSLAETGDQNTRGAGRDILRGFENLVGSEFNDRLSGNNNANNIAGGSGDDFIFGGRGADSLEGGSGRDRFVFQSEFDSGNSGGTSDVILDFTKGTDLIDLSAIDASGNLRGNNAFVWNGATNSFGTSTSGELRYAYEGSNTVIYGDTDRDAASEFRIVLKGTYVLEAGDFVL